jgi:DNA repair protein RadC
MTSILAPADDRTTAPACSPDPVAAPTPAPTPAPSSAASPATTLHGGLVPAPLGWAFQPGDPETRPQVTTPDDAAALVLPLLRGRDRELCILVALDTKHRLISLSTVSVGSADHTFMGPREVFRDALCSGATAIFVAHNHPSGDATPSADDRLITRRLASAGSLLGIDLLDHLVVGDPEWTSLARLGVL